MSEARLMAALKAPDAPLRDPGFALLVLQRAEQRRFARAGLRAMLRGGGYAGAACALLLLLAAWANAHAGPVADGAVSAAILIAIAWLTRRLIGRLSGRSN